MHLEVKATCLVCGKVVARLEQQDEGQLEGLVVSVRIPDHYCTGRAGGFWGGGELREKVLKEEVNDGR